MNDLERVACPQCRSEQSDVVTRGRDYLHELPGEFFVAECRTCGLWFQNPRPTAARLASLYPADYRPHTATERTVDAPPPLRTSMARYLRERLAYPDLPVSHPGGRLDWRSLPLFDSLRRWKAGVALLPRFVPDGTLLEIGCGNGTRLASLRSYGWRRLNGIELVAAAAAEAQAKGFAVDCGPVESTLESRADGSLDVIVSSMVLEHLYDPFDVVRRIAAKLKPGGQFLFSTIVRDSLDAQMYGKFWSGFDFPRHMVHFRRRDLDAMLADHFDQVEYFYQWAPIDFVRSASWRRRDGEGRRLDDVIARMGTSRGAGIAGTALAWLGRTCRVSCRCRRKP